MPKTYAPIARQVLTSNSSSIVFSSIPQTYTDLVLVCQPVSASDTDGALRINSDTGTNYSITSVYAQPTGVGSYRRSNATFMDYNYYASIYTTVKNQNVMHFMNYANTSTYKTVLMSPRVATQGSEFLIGLWRSTAAISTITVGANSGFSTNFVPGSTFTLYGILKA
jgi:hypothetical protein